MPGVSVAIMPENLPSPLPADSPRFTANDDVSPLVGHTIKEVERKLILHTLGYHGGNRTRSASVLGISIRTLRNKINGYGALGIAVPASDQHRVLVET
jgi:DNA-binding NtrC family response regulator